MAIASVDRVNIVHRATKRDESNRIALNAFDPRGRGDGSHLSAPFGVRQDVSNDT
ncbi:MAG: hypothetical protein ABSC06_26810 [Rhodopila sp.]